jgi:hypothetical protein
MLICDAWQQLEHTIHRRKSRNRASEALSAMFNFGSVNLFNTCNYYDYLILIVVIISCDHFGLVNLFNT